jgi:sulfate adenylyltransferase subunit 1
MAAILPIETDDALEVFLDREAQKELLRFTTAGSVDDGKSTLIGRLLHDCQAVYEDQLEAVKKSRINRSGKAVDLSLLTDGLRAEREQGITIDVAYRYFSTSRRKFIIADTPGHEQYTRNMVTGASTADLAVILVDATKGLLQQTRRHAYIASLLGIHHVIAAVNKMDLAGYDEKTFSRLTQEFSALAAALEIAQVQCIPISALEGDNVVERSGKAAWYSGPTLLQHLENVPLRPVLDRQTLRFPVQSVIRPDASFRGFAGRVASGSLRPGDDVLVLPSKQRNRIESIAAFDGQLDFARAGESVVLRLADEIDVSRGDLIVSPTDPPFVSRTLSAMVVWLHEAPLELGRQYLAKHLGRHVKLKASRMRHRVDINELTKHAADHLALNEIGFVEFEASQPLYFDSYRRNRTTGSLILIDPLSNATVGAAMIRETLEPVLESRTARDETSLIELQGGVTPAERTQRRGHSPALLLVSGDRSFAQAIERDLFSRGFDVAVVDYRQTGAATVGVLLTALWHLGLLSIIWAATPFETQEKEVLRNIAATSVCDLTEGSADEHAELLRQRALEFAEALRTGGRTAGHKGT